MLQNHFPIGVQQLNKSIVGLSGYQLLRVETIQKLRPALKLYQKKCIR